MRCKLFEERKKLLTEKHAALITRKNEIEPDWFNGLFDRYRHPVLTVEHIPLSWRYDFNPTTNPCFMERLGVNAVFNPGAIELNGKIFIAARIEGYDRKSFFAIAEGENGVDNFRFWDYPIIMPETERPDTNVYDMRLVKHEDGWIYGVFCAERKDPRTPPGDTTSAVAQSGIARTRDLRVWERLPDIKTPSAQQRNVVLHPEFVNGKYAFYTRPMDDFFTGGGGGGIGWGLADKIDGVEISEETIIDRRVYHTIKEGKNGEGPAPIKTGKGWLHIAHGVRNNAAGMRYVLYAFLSDLQEPWKVTHQPGGYLLAPWGEERVGDVSDVVFCNAAVARPNGDLLIYYGSSDTRTHVAKTTVDKLLDYVLNTPEDPLRSAACVQQRIDLINRNEKFI